MTWFDWRAFFGGEVGVFLGVGAVLMVVALLVRRRIQHPIGMTIVYAVCVTLLVMVFVTGMILWENPHELLGGSAHMPYPTQPASRESQIHFGAWLGGLVGVWIAVLSSPVVLAWSLAGVSSGVRKGSLVARTAFQWPLLTAILTAVVVHWCNTERSYLYLERAVWVVSWATVLLWRDGRALATLLRVRHQPVIDQETFGEVVIDVGVGDERRQIPLLWATMPERRPETYRQIEPERPKVLVRGSRRHGLVNVVPLVGVALLIVVLELLLLAQRWDAYWDRPGRVYGPTIGQASDLQDQSRGDSGDRAEVVDDLHSIPGIDRRMVGDRISIPGIDRRMVGDRISIPRVDRRWSARAFRTGESTGGRSATGFRFPESTGGCRRGRFEPQSEHRHSHAAANQFS